MSYLETKRKAVAEKGLVLLPKEEATETLKKHTFYIGEATRPKETEVSRELMASDGGTKRYRVVREVEEYDQNEADRRFYLRLLDEGFELYRDKESKLVIMPPDRILEGWDREELEKLLEEQRNLKKMLEALYTT